MAYLLDGSTVKNIALDQYPPEAWTFFGGDATGNEKERKYYEEIAWIYRCVNLRAQAVVSTPWSIYRGDTELWTHTDKAPNEFSWLNNLPTLLYLTESAQTIGGEAFWFKVRNASRMLDIKWLAPSSMIPQWSQTDGLVGFKRMLGNGQTRMLDVEDVVYFALPNPLHETKPGVSPVQAVSQAANVLYSVDEFARKFFERGAIKATLLTVEGQPPKAEMEKLEAWWKRFFGGVSKAWESAAVSASVKPVIVGEGIESLSSESLTKERKEDIATGLGVPHSLVMSNAANYATAQSDRLNFWEMTVIPECRLISENMNTQLLDSLGLELRFQPQELSIFQEDEEQRSAALLNLTNAGISLDMALAILGFTLPEGMTLAPPVTVQTPQAATPEASFVAVPDANAATRSADLGRFKRWAKKRTNPDPDDFKSDVLSYEDKAAVLYDMMTEGGDADTMPPFTLPDGTLTPEEIKAMILQLDPGDDEAEQKIRMSIERAMERELAAELAKQAAAVTASAPDSAADAIERATDGNERVRDILRRRLTQSAALGVSVAVDQFDKIGFGFDWTLANQAAAEWANRYTYELVTGIEDTTRRRLQTAVTEWINNGDTLDDLRKELEPTFGRQRAQLIASTETTRAYSEANRIAYRESGVTDKVEWRTSADERVCPICGPLDRTQTGLTVGWPEVGFPPAHPRCRCWVVPVIEN